jgi:hypothetical protein
VLHDLAVYALGVLMLCVGKAAIHRGLTALFAKLCPGPRPRRLRYRLGRWTLTLERED